MRASNRCLGLLLVVWVVFLFAAPARAQSLVTNGGFETGSFSGWTQGGNTGFTTVQTTNVQSGTYSARMGPVTTNGTLSQTITTEVGARYAVSFFLRNGSNGTNNFSASFAGVTGYSITNNAAFGYRKLGFIVTATSTSSTLLFTFRNDPSYWYLDTIVITKVPELSSAAATLPLAILLGLFLLVLDRRRVSAHG